MTSPKKYFQEVIHQAKKVRWPNFTTFINLFTVVLVVLVIAGLILMFENWTGLNLMNSLKDALGTIVNSASSTTSA